MNKHLIIRIIRTTLKVLVALAAAVNLVALFAYHYKMPSWLPWGQEETAAEVVVKIDPELSPQALDSTEDAVRFSIPVVPVNYSGEADMDALVLDGVYVQGEGEQPIDGIQISYSILPGESRLKKTIQYSATLDSGETLTETRVMNLTSRYTGPTISLQSSLPDIDPDDADVYAGRLGAKGIIHADDGFGNDAAEMVYAVFDDLSDEYPDSGMTLVIENQVHDTYELDLTVQVEDYTGVVVSLTDHRITLSEGDEFDPYDYIAYAHDTEGNDLTDDVTADSNVSTDVPGEYEVWYWAKDSEGTYSPTKKLYVTVEAAPEETEESEENAP